ncbi:NB-LRR type disease resistance protein Rps1-k-2 [Trifolium medium]|uniref:NB-LRR type disease resistance protein Rps1-k-2 n=1 Tax=Trifolium medium TaxID=97028 RepID=A0A392MEU1_9FABA|nr:NB-LRR type disease resistance protein Rps1-k-2 [Trifolium medium]
MPSEMSKLTRLQHLSCFVVGKHEKKGVKELGTLSDLHGSLSIKKLENINNNFEALEARIMDKKYLEELELEWSIDAEDNIQNSQSEMDILGNLQPGKYLKRLDIDGYRGTRFPEWVGDPSYQNLTELSLYGCQNCFMLPPLGQIHSLKNLTICGMSMLKTIEPEFFKNGDYFSETPFPSLEHLMFDDMSCWEVWNHPRESYASFSVLKSLVIRGCPRLRGNLPTHLHALETIEIEVCNQLASSLPRAPSMRKLVIHESNKVALQELPLSLKELRIKGREITESIFEAIAITLQTSLRTLDIRNCSSTMSFPGDCLPASLKSLYLENCRNLDFPKQSPEHESLQYLCIDRSCDSLTTLPLEILQNLNHLFIRNCENIKCLSASKVFQNLVDIEIRECSKFVSFPREGLSAPNLTSLYVSRCVNLKSLPCRANTLLPKLEKVTISNCSEMETFPEGGMPPSLRSLYIRNCEKLMRSSSLTSMDMLMHLSIGGPCDGVESFSKGGDFSTSHPSRN